MVSTMISSIILRKFYYNYNYETDHAINFIISLTNVDNTIEDIENYFCLMSNNFKNEFSNIIFVTLLKLLIASKEEKYQIFAQCAINIYDLMDIEKLHANDNLKFQLYQSINELKN